VRSIHGTSYTRLHDAELVHLLQEFAVDFQPPQTAMGGGTELYAGEQDMFAFLIDPAGWAEIEGEAFAPEFFLWNSEVGRRSVGIQTFWFQAVCQNHIVWDAVEVVDFSRKHAANVHESLVAVRQIIESLVATDGLSGRCPFSVLPRRGTAELFALELVLSIHLTDLSYQARASSWCVSCQWAAAMKSH